MKKMKALFLSLALLFTVGVTVTGCAAKGNSSESSIEEGFSNSTEDLVSVAFEKADVSFT